MRIVFADYSQREFKIRNRYHAKISVFMISGLITETLRRKLQIELCINAYQISDKTVCKVIRFDCGEKIKAKSSQKSQEIFNSRRPLFDKSMKGP